MDKYLKFSGVASRSEFWAVQLLAVPIFFLLTITAMGMAAMGSSGLIASAVFLVITMIIMAVLTISTTVRRCRDAGINPWFTLAIFVPYIGIIPWIVFGCLKTEKDNVNGNS